MKKRIMKKTHKLLLIPIVAALSLFSPNYANAQTANVTQIVSTIPEQKPATGKIHYINKDNGETSSVDIDTTTGEASTILVPGNYIREIKDIGYGRFIDTNFVITGDRRDTIELIKGFKVNPIATGGVSDNGILLMKLYTLTLPWMNDQFAEFWKLQDRPITIWANNDSMPNENYRIWLNNAKNNLTTKSDSAVKFQETNIMPPTEGGIGIRFHYVLNNNMPTPGLSGEALTIKRYADNSPKLVDIYINREVSGNRQATIIREILRALGFSAYTLDPTSPLYSGGARVDTINIDDAEIIKRYYRKQNIPAYMGFYDTTTVSDVNTVRMIESGIPQAYILRPNYPNPFNDGTKIRFDIPETGIVRFEIYDILGRKIETLIEEKLTPGIYEKQINLEGLSSGTYYLILRAHSTLATQKLLYIK